LVREFGFVLVVALVLTSLNITEADSRRIVPRQEYAISTCEFPWLPRRT
jgi:hypothetical protein